MVLGPPTKSWWTVPTRVRTICGCLIPSPCKLTLPCEDLASMRTTPFARKSRKSPTLPLQGKATHCPSTDSESSIPRQFERLEADTCHRIIESVTRNQQAEVSDDDQDRQQLFKIDRPKLDHIVPPFDYDPGPIFDPGLSPDDNMARVQRWLKANLKATGGEGNLDSSAHHSEDGSVPDEEGDPATGRVSPCTFRHWATGAGRSDDGHAEVSISPMPGPEFPSSLCGDH